MCDRIQSCESCQNINVSLSNIMNALTVQNPHHKCDLGNKNDSVTDKKITTENI